MRHVFIATSLVFGLLAAPAFAVTTTTTVTLSGTFISGRDNIGLFTPWGTYLTGQSFSATYTLVTDAISSTGGVPGFDLVNFAPGATSMAYSLTINNRTYSDTANSAGAMSTADGFLGAADGGDDKFQVSAQTTTVLQSTTRTFELSASVGGALHDILSDTHSINAIPSFSYQPVAGDQATGGFYLTQSPGALDTLSFGAFNIDQITVSSTPELSNASLPVPEPGEWAMIAAGLGLVAFTANRRRAA